MKFGSVLFSEDSSARLSNVWPNINSPREEGLDTQHGDHIQQNQLHVNVLGNHHISIQPDWKKKNYSRWLPSITCTRVTVPTSLF